MSVDSFAAYDKVAIVNIRRGLARFWIDTSQLRVRCTRGIVFIGGYIQRITYEHAELDDKRLRQLDVELRRVKHVRDIVYQLENWERLHNGGWRWMGGKRKGDVDQMPTSDETVKTVSTIQIIEDEEQSPPDLSEAEDEETS